MEIMSMFMVHDLKKRCLCVRFIIFNYASKKFVYFGVYEKLQYLLEFEVFRLRDLSKMSLDLIKYEVAPFKLHILCLQSIINTHRKIEIPEVLVIPEVIIPPKPVVIKP
jgi:hypothetical protein